MLNFHVIQMPWRHGIGLYVTDKIGTDIALLSPGEYKTVEIGTRRQEYEPTLDLAQEDAQALSDALASAGIRPSTETRAEQKATQAHLTDLRRIAFKGLKIE